MLSKNRIAVLVALLFAVPVAVAALEQAAPSGIAESVESRAEAQPMESAAQPVAAGSEQVIGTAPEGGLVRATPSDAFPKGSDVEWEIMPALARYLDEMERKRGPLVARGDVFPQGSEVEWEMLPAQIAYFDRLERQRVAGAQPATQAAAPVASAAPAGESRNPLLKATDYISGLLKADSATAPAGNTAAAQ
jgi:hypothetical protein